MVMRESCVVTCVVTPRSLPVSGVLASCRSGTGEGGTAENRVNTAHPCYMDFFDVTVSWTGSRIRDEGSAVSPPTL
jgi:hypothetical protein